jgi:RNA polymerase-binding transcription factor DksA
MEKRSPVKTRLRRKASATEVLGENPAQQVPPQWRPYHDRLLEIRAYLRRRKRSQLGSAKQQNLKFSQHMADAGTNSFEKDLALSRVSSEQDALFEIGEALSRIHNGTYGVCEKTGKPIPTERLNAIPWTRFATDVEKELEASGQVEKAKLPQAARIGRASTSNSLGETWNQEEQTRPVKRTGQGRRRGAMNK